MQFNTTIEFLSIEITVNIDHTIIEWYNWIAKPNVVIEIDAEVNHGVPDDSRLAEAIMVGLIKQ